MPKKTNIFFLGGAIVLMWAALARAQAAAPSLSHSDIQANCSDSATNPRTIQIRLFIDDRERELGGDWILEIRSVGMLLDLHKVDNDRVIIGDISEPCSFRFKRGNEEAQFDVGAHLFRCGGELLVSFITKPALLNKEVSLVDGETSRIERFQGYDEARSRVSAGWRKLSKEETKRVRRAVFYRFVPDTDYDPVVETGLFFDTVRH